VTELLLNDRKR